MFSAPYQQYASSYWPHQSSSVSPTGAQTQSRLSLSNIFGFRQTAEIGDRVQQSLGFSGNQQQTPANPYSTSEDYLHIDVAPSYGSLDSNSIRMVDEDLKVAISGTMRSMEIARQKGQLSWETVMATFMSSPILEPMDNGLFRANSYTKQNQGWASDYTGIIREVESWFNQLISDDDVLRSTQIDINVMANIVAQTAATSNSFFSQYNQQNRYEKTLLDIGVLRFPDLQNPFFKVYRIKLTAWCFSDGSYFNPTKSSGIKGEYNARRFKPRQNVIQKLGTQVLQQAVSEAEELFAPRLQGQLGAQKSPVIQQPAANSQVMSNAPVPQQQWSPPASGGWPYGYW